MVRLLCDVRGQYRLDFLKEIEKQSEGEVTVALTAGDRGADIFARGITTMKRDPRHERLHNGLMRDSTHTGANAALLASPEFHEMATMAIDHFQRMSPTYRYNSHNLVNLQDYLDYYYILTDVMARRMIEEKITHAVFFMVPHLGYDTVLYQVARSLGIKTLVMNQQGLFNDRYFSSGSIEDYGCFDAAQTTAAPIPLQKGKLPDLFFMDKKWQQPGQTGKISSAAIFQFLKYVARYEPKRLLQPSYLLTMLRRISAIYESLPDWRDPYADFFHTNALAYYEHLAEYERGHIDLDRPFVYVPMHNQPEMSASTLGGRYRDQVLMIEAVARSMPEDWLVYVKENPRQGAYARGPLYFHRLSRMANVRLVPSHTSSQALVAKAKLVATVAGTAGWEGLLSGVPAVTFGGAWYRSLSGATPFREGINLADVAARGVDHTVLEANYGALIDRSHTGLIDSLFFDKVEKFDQDANRVQVAETVIELVTGKRPTTFGSL
ncbi:hypothetical protein ACEN2J_13410 [Pseudorhodobacter sp. W20_MBD10_FR17]|uniref:capsular polysaccharide export protein, LipB/KpsS family n=1 Tax=Pseudorhodobacter sp. W20_MBD10_FR17 TaxID=3240266 RepID=UPI003F9E05CC